MKTIATMGVVLALCSCGASTTERTHYASTQDNRPPTDFELEVANARDNTLQVVPMDPKVEQTKYEASLVHINEEMKTEYLQLQMCSETYDMGQYCKDMLKRFCLVDELIDTRSDIHKKPYCFQKSGH